MFGRHQYPDNDEIISGHNRNPPISQYWRLVAFGRYIGRIKLLYGYPNIGILHVLKISVSNTDIENILLSLLVDGFWTTPDQHHCLLDGIIDAITMGKAADKL